MFFDSSALDKVSALVYKCYMLTNAASMHPVATVLESSDMMQASCAGQVICGLRSSASEGKIESAIEVFDICIIKALHSSSIVERRID